MVQGIMKSAIITRIIKESKDCISIYLRSLKYRISKPKPGQFIMLWVPSYEEIPMSISGYYGDELRITVKARGATTKYLVNNAKPGLFLGFKGPLGRGIDDVKKLWNQKVVLIAGGIGIAPLAHLAYEIHSIADTYLIYGTRSASELILLKEFKNLCKDIYISTDDGSRGFKGTVVELATKVLPLIKPDAVIVAGPKEILKEIALYANKIGIDGWILGESIFKCGIGACGSCTIGKYILCKDGPVLTIKEFIKAIEMGN